MKGQYDFSEIARLFYPGRTVKGDHPILENLRHPVFKKILQQTDQVAIIVNHSSLTYEYVSENIFTLCGFPASDFLTKGGSFSFSLMHPDDAYDLQHTVFPVYEDCINRLSREQRLDVQLSYTYRIRKADGRYMQVLQQSVPLSFENDKALLGLLVVTDISGFKKDNKVAYRNLLLKEGAPAIVLAQGSCDNNLFSTRELNILQLLAEGQSEKHMAERLSLSIYTIKTHRKNMLKKAGVKNASELVRYGMAHLLL